MDIGLQSLGDLGEVILGMGVIYAILEDWEIHLLPYIY